MSCWNNVSSLIICQFKHIICFLSVNTNRTAVPICPIEKCLAEQHGVLMLPLASRIPYIYCFSSFHLSLLSLSLCGALHSNLERDWQVIPFSPSHFFCLTGSPSLSFPIWYVFWSESVQICSCRTPLCPPSGSNSLPESLILSHSAFSQPHINPTVQPRSPSPSLKRSKAEWKSLLAHQPWMVLSWYRPLV